MHLDLEPPFLIVKPNMTEHDFYRLADEDSNWEYLDGRIVMHSPASFRHEDVFQFLTTLVRGFADERSRGAVVLGSRYPMRLDEQWSPEPDLMVVRPERFNLIRTTHLDGPADFVIEITSDSDPKLDYREKLPRYRAAGIEEIWVVDRVARHVHVETKLADGYQTRVIRRGKLQSSVLRGFWLNVSWLWHRNLPSSFKCLRGILE